MSKELQETLKDLNDNLNTKVAPWSEHLTKRAHDKNISIGEWNELLQRAGLLSNDLTIIVKALTEVAECVGLGALPDTGDGPADSVIESISISNARSKNYTDSIVKALQEALQKSFKTENLEASEATVENLEASKVVVENLEVTGTTVTKSQETLTVKDNLIITNGTNTPLGKRYSGIVSLTGVEDGDGNPVAYGVVYVPEDNVIKLGEGTLKAEGSDGLYFEFSPTEAQALATREDDVEDNHIIQWDAETSALKDSGKSVDDFLPHFNTLDFEDTTTVLYRYNPSTKKLDTVKVETKVDADAVVKRDATGNILLPEEYVGYTSNTADECRAVPQYYVDQILADSSNALRTQMNEKFDNYDYIMRQFGVITEEIKNEVANRILVPARSDRFMYLNRIGGKSYSTENYLNPKYFSGGTDGFLTITHNGDGMITVNGTGEVISNYDFCFNLYNPPLKSFPLNNEEWYLSVDEPLPENMAIAAFAGNPDTGLEDGYWLYGDVTSVKIWGDPYLNVIQILPPYDTEGGTITADNVTIKLTLSKGEPKKYTPFFEGLRDTKVTALRNNGANLIPFPYKDGMSKTANGITFTVNADGSIHAKGTATANTYFYLHSFGKEAEKFASANVTALNAVQTFEGKTYKDCYFYYRDNVVMLQIASGTTVDRTYCPMINYGETIAPYKPYREPIITAIPEAIQAIDGYGKGVNGTYYNYIDLERKVFVKNIHRLVITGTENWGLQKSAVSVNTALYQYQVIDNIPPKGISTVPALCNAFEQRTDTFNVDVKCFTVMNSGEGATNPYIRIRTTPFANVISFRNWLKGLYANGTPIVIEYPLAEPIETDISGIMGELEPLIEVEGGGSVDLVNEHNNAVPYTATFNIINSN